MPTFEKSQQDINDVERHPGKLLLTALTSSVLLLGYLLTSKTPADIEDVQRNVNIVDAC